MCDPCQVRYEQQIREMHKEEKEAETEYDWGKA